MKPIPFENTWPYEQQMGDIYLEPCPFCGEGRILTNMSQEALGRAKEGIKTRIQLQCCRETMVVLEADDDYFWTQHTLR
ncbi:hypothetical protein [Alkalicoccus chagannorensis]|uniref:hypothetical protein n=1 Tax=Alkalicoccus chagannorensis TaxID=427072 RepID=UPI0003FBE47B|nr:hypothetical protein [Alkalicoccus chagannorensis]